MFLLSCVLKSDNPGLKHLKINKLTQDVSVSCKYLIESETNDENDGEEFGSGEEVLHFGCQGCAHDVDEGDGEDDSQSEQLQRPLAQVAVF